MDEINNKEQETLLQHRLQGILPQIDIAGQDYIIDLRMEALRSVDEPYVQLRFEDMNYDELLGTYDFLFSPSSKNIIVPHPELRALPADTLAVLIPEATALDPVGLVRQTRVDFKKFLSENPIQKELKANVLVLDEGMRKEIIAAMQQPDVYMAYSLNKEAFQQTANPAKKTAHKKGRHL